MEVNIKEFENRAIDAVSELCNLLGAVRVDMSIRVDKYGKTCKTDVTFVTTRPEDASDVPGGGPACKGD